jgi:hypothetical protein
MVYILNDIQMLYLINNSQIETYININLKTVLHGLDLNYDVRSDVEAGVTNKGQVLN